MPASPKFQLNVLIVVPEAGVLASVKVKEFPDKHWVLLSIVNAGVGAGRLETVMAKLAAEEVPQALVAVTDKVPELVLFTKFRFVVEEEPVQPAGSVQL